MVKDPRGFDPPPSSPLRVMRWPSPKLVALIVRVSALIPVELAPMEPRVMAAPAATPPLVESMIELDVKE